MSIHLRSVLQVIQAAIGEVLDVALLATRGQYVEDPLDGHTTPQDVERSIRNLQEKR